MSVVIKISTENRFKKLLSGQNMSKNENKKILITMIQGKTLAKRTDRLPSILTKKNTKKESKTVERYLSVQLSTV